MVPWPGEAIVSLPGSRRASSMNSFRSLAGTDGCTSSTSGVIVIERDGDEIPLPVIGVALGDLGREQHRTVGADEQGVAVGRHFRERLAGDQAAGAGLVFHDEGLAQLRLQPVGDDARRAVDIAACRIGDDQAYLPRRPLLGVGRRAQRYREQCRYSDACDREKFHRILPKSGISAATFVLREPRPSGMRMYCSAPRSCARPFRCRPNCGVFVHIVDSGQRV